MGHGKWACITLCALVAEGYNIVGVITETEKFDKKEAKTYSRFARFGAYDSLKEVAERLGLPVYRPRDVNSKKFVRVVEKLAPEYIVVVSYHQIIGESLLEKFKDRIINVHIGHLPHYRGRAPINWAIINGERKIGITVHLMTKDIDAGPIVMQRFIKISDEERAIDVLLRALPGFPFMILRSLRLLETGKIKPIPQNPFEGSYFPRRRPQDGYIRWFNETALDIHNKVRALAYPYPGAFVRHRGKKVIIEKTSQPKNQKRISPVPGIVFGKTENGGVKVTTIDGFIVIEEIRKGERALKASEYFKVGNKLE